MAEALSEVGQDLIIKAEDDHMDDTPKMKVRPTYGGRYLNRPDMNEADDNVVMSVKSFLAPDAAIPQAFPTPTLTPRLWTADEEEELRCWAQDFGARDWNMIAWCLRRSVKECQERCGQIIVARNLQANRDPQGGLPRDVDSYFPDALASALAVSTTSEPDVQEARPTATIPSATTRRLRPQSQLRTPSRLPGDTAYDPKTKSTQKVTRSGVVVDSNGIRIPGTEQELGSALAESRTKKTLRQRLMLTVEPREQVDSGDEGSSKPPGVDEVRARQAGVAKRYGNGGWRYGASRRAGHPKK